jgi:S1-C subfamily serine protease
MTRPLTVWLMPLALALAATVTSPAAEVADAARAALASSADSVVAVRLVVKMKMNMQGQSQDSEQKIELNATVIDPAGLAVTSASQLDPTIALKSVLGHMGQQAAMIQVDSEIKETTVLLADGTEVEADIVLTDKDLDLAFVRLRDAKQKLPAATLAKRAAPARPLDAVFVIGRADKAANRTSTASVGAIKCFVKGPQPYYLTDAETATNVGCLVYAADGSPLGVVVSKIAMGGEGGAEGMMAMLTMISKPNELMPVHVVRPVEQEMELATQALTAKPAGDAAPKTESVAP